MEKIIPVNCLEQYKQDTVEYGIYVNRVRATPNGKDGLKPIHRRILYTEAMLEKCITTRVKSSAVVGTCMKKLHPHGDTAIYNSMKPMSNWFEINIPLLNPEASWGNVQGDTQAAMRYTETQISKFGYEVVIGELKETKNIVDWVETYDNKDVEPEYLPVRAPLLLINGCFGIGLGLSSRVPAHNINEVIDATIKLINNPNAEVVLVPDQSMPCEIVETNFKAISKTGSGSYTVRGIIEVGEYRNNPAVIIKSIPDLTFLNTITEKIEKLVEDKKLLQVVDIYDQCEESKDNVYIENAVRCVIVLKKGTDPNYVRDFIYKNTEMEKTFSVNFEVLCGVDPIRMSYKSYLQTFILDRLTTKFRYYSNKLQQVQTKYHEKEAFVKVLRSGKVNKIIDMIKKQNTTDDSTIIEYMIKNMGITDLQASYIINVNVKRLSPAYLPKYEEELNALTQEKDIYMHKLLNEELLREEMIQELKDIKAKYGKPRMCRIIDKAELNNIPKGTFTIVITENNFIKKVPVNTTIGSFKGDSPKLAITIENTDNLIIFDEQGKVFKIPVHKVPISDRSSNGIDIRTLFNKITSNINKIVSETELTTLNNKRKKVFITTLTQKGNIKRLDIADILSAPPSGILYTKLDSDDIVKDISLVQDGCDVVVYSKNKALRMHITDIPHSKRNTKGNKAMSEDTVDGLAIIKADTTDILVITESGKVNRIDVLALPIMGRNKSGTKIMKLSKGDAIHSIKSVNRNDSMLSIITKSNRYDFVVNEIPQGSSISAGTKLISTKIDNIIKCDINKIAQQ